MNEDKTAVINNSYNNSETSEIPVVPQNNNSSNMDDEQATRVIKSVGSYQPDNISFDDFVDDSNDNYGNNRGYNAVNPAIMPNNYVTSGNYNSRGFAERGGDLVKQPRKPLYKSALFWVIFFITLLVVIPLFTSLLHPLSSNNTNSNPAPSTSMDIIQSPNKSDSNGDNQSKPAPTQTPASPVDTFNWDSLVGQNLSNAYALLRHNGIDRYNDIHVDYVTDDGSPMFIESQWVISKIDKKDNNILFYLKHPDKPKDNNSNGNNSQNNNNGGLFKLPSFGWDSIKDSVGSAAKGTGELIKGAFDRLTNH